MTTTLSIGDFSRMTFLSVKQLRHYHELGLLEPASVDPQNGYRHYTADQVPTAQVIRRFRDLGMPLEELRTVLTAADVEARNAAIFAHLQRMEAELQQNQATVASLRNLLERGRPTIPIEYRRRPATATLAISEKIDGSNLAAWLKGAFAALHAELERQGLDRGGPDSALYTAELLESGIGEVTALVAVRGPADSAGRIQSLDLPAAEFAVVVHRGPSNDLDQSFAALGTHIAERTIGVDGPIQENYPDAHTIEVCWPIFQTTTGAQS